MEKQTKIEMVPLSQIEADELQPRRTFNPARISELAKSIKRLGIEQPLVVQKLATGKYVLIDGERRFRAAIELKLKEVPVIIKDEMTETNRLIHQFHLQEQHEDWSALEKAVAVGRLAEDTGMSVAQIAETLSLSERTIGDYHAFSKLVAKKEFQKSEIPATWARSIVSLKNHVKRVYADVLEEEFTKQDEKALEIAVIDRFRTGDIKRPSEMAKIKDMVTQEPKSIEKFITNEKVSLDKLYIDTHGKVATLTRNLATACGWSASYIMQGIPLGMVDLVNADERTRTAVKKAYAKLGELIKQLD